MIDDPRRASFARQGLRQFVLVVGLAAWLVAGFAACWTSALRTIPETRSPYDTLPSQSLRRLARACADLEQGRTEAARSALQTLAVEHPNNIAVGARLQDAEIAVSTQERGAAAAAEDLRAVYRARAEEAPNVANLVLAARLEPDPLAAQVLLDRAEKLDPRCAWCPYGRAWLAARAGDWERAREHVARAKAADPGHMPTLWLDTWMLARAGNLAESITSLDTWIAGAQGDPRLDPSLLLAARLDRALLAVLDDDPERAMEILEELEGEPASGADAARLAMIQAGAEEASGEPEAALAAAREAEAALAVRPADEARDNAILPAVQQALLHEMWLGDPQAAEKDWERVLELSRSDAAMSSLLERVRARVRLERAARAERAARIGGTARVESGHGADAAREGDRAVKSPDRAQ